MRVSNINPYASSQADIPQHNYDELELATRGSRLLAVIIDSLAFAGIGIAAALVIPAARGNPTLGLLFGAIAGTIILAVIIYNFVLLYRSGQTIGKRAMHIAVVRKDGDRCSLSRYIFLRIISVAFIGGIFNVIVPFGGLFSLVDSLMIFQDSRQCLHDLIADTIVVKFHA